MALSWLTLLLSGVIGVAAGTLIGCIGVGGVILVPLLILRPDVSVHVAVVACMAAYVPAGLGGAVAYVRKGGVPWRSALLMCLPSAPAALLGSWTLLQLSGYLIKLILYSVMLMTSCLSAVRSLHAIWKERREKNGGHDNQNAKEDACEERSSEERLDTDTAAADENAEDTSVLLPHNVHGDIETKRQDQAANAAKSDGSNHEASVEEEIPCFGSMSFAQLVQALCVGTIAGFGSALTGTSGPVLLLPMLFIFLWPALPALGCAQVIQVPIALAATIGNVFLASSQLDLAEVFKLAACVATGLVPFVFLGAAIANYLPQRALKVIVAVVLVVASLVLLLKEVL